MLKYAQSCLNMLNPAQICSIMLKYAQICSIMLNLVEDDLRYSDPVDRLESVSSKNCHILGI